MNKYRIEYCEENGIKVKEFNKYNVNNYTNFLENKLAAINYTHSCKSDSELLKCGECDCKIKYPDLGMDKLKDCKKEW